MLYQIPLYQILLYHFPLYHFPLHQIPLWQFPLYQYPCTLLTRHKMKSLLQYGNRRRMQNIGRWMYAVFGARLPAARFTCDWRNERRKDNTQQGRHAPPPLPTKQIGRKLTKYLQLVLLSFSACLHQLAFPPPLSLGGVRSPPCSRLLWLTQGAMK